ncbi:MAG: methylated-DNA--[protein]-cysteine S-methyltransferase [Bacilli bacterium]
MNVYWSSLTAGGWTLHVAATPLGLCCITLPRGAFAELEAWTARQIADAVLQRDDARLAPYLGQLQTYFDGTRKEFTVPMDLRGTPFQVSVWRTLMTIPYGETKSYSEIAEAIHRPTATRAVGLANRANPVPIVVPCHRVIGKNGTLTGYSGGLDIKRRLLALERAPCSQAPGFDEAPTIVDSGM